MLRFIALTLGLFVFWTLPVAAKTASAHPGYLDSVADERYQKIQEMVLIPDPNEGAPSLKEIIFDERLTEEFQSRYEDTFGRTEIERNFFAPNRFDELEYDTGRSVSIEEDRKERQRFAGYMMRRLGEHHVDNYFKSNPSMRTVYELKDKVSKLNVDVSKGYKFRISYSFSGNYTDFKVENPYDIDTKLRLEMGSQEAILSLGYYVSPRVWLGSFVHSKAGKVSLITSRALAPGVNISLTGTVNYLYESNTEEGQNLVLVGLGWTQ